MRLIEKAKCLVFMFCFAWGSRLSPPRITALWEPRGLCHGCRDRKCLWKHKHIIIKCEALSDPSFDEGSSSFPTLPAWQVHPTLYKNTPWTYKQKPRKHVPMWGVWRLFRGAGCFLGQASALPFLSSLLGFLPFLLLLIWKPRLCLFVLKHPPL